jgi:hypothetical protein
VRAGAVAAGLVGAGLALVAGAVVLAGAVLAAGAAVIDVSAAEAGLAAGWALVKLMLVVRVLTWARCSGLS